MSKKQNEVLLFLFLFPNLFFGQGLNNLWLIGYDCCYPNFQPVTVDFQSGFWSLSNSSRPMNLNTTNAVISDSLGSLLFYTNGVYIANNLDDTMLNGYGLNPCDFTTAHTQYGLTIPQAALVIPFPDHPNQYYLFHNTADDRFNTYASFYLYYSIVDMSLDSGKGAVTQKNIVLKNDTLVEGRLTACKHSNGRDWWIICHEYDTPIYFKYLLTPYGIQGPWSQNIGSTRKNYFGQCKFSNSGTRFAYYEPWENDLDIFDFDRCSGLFSNSRNIAIYDSAAGGGLAFSPTDRYLYLSSDSFIYQFDLQAPIISQSKIIVGVYNGGSTLGFSTRFYLSELAPDGKIYVNCGNSTLDLHVINYPDSVGLGCGFCQQCIHLPGLNAFTIPNYPNYFLGADTTSICDSLNTGIDPKWSTQTSELLLFPNPVKSLFYISIPKDLDLVEVEISNSLGQSIAAPIFRISNGEYIQCDASRLSPGVYFVSIKTKNSIQVKRFIKE